MTARNAILQRLKSAEVPHVPRPASFIAIAPEPITAAEAAVIPGAECYEASALYEVISERLRLSLTPEVETSSDLLNTQFDAHTLLTLDTTVCRGDFIVRENGAIWIPVEGIDPRAAIFTCRHLVILIDPTQIEDTMNDAFRRVAENPSRPGYFLTGPSKTADIEQCLVVGAQGARKVTVVLKPNVG